MKKVFDSKAFWLIVSLLTSLILWVYITGIESDQYTKTLRGVEVEFVGESILSDRGLVICDLSTNTVTVEIKGPRRTVAGLSSSDISAQINVSNLSQSALASMQYSIKYPDGTNSANISVTRKIPETVTFNVSKNSSKTIPVKGSFDGNTAEGYTAEAVSFEPETITVSGAERYLEDVSFAWVSFGAEDVESTYSEEVGFTLMNSQKEPVDSENIVCSTQTVIAKLPVLRMKSVPLSINLNYTAGATESNTKVTIEPAYINISGSSEVVEGISKITLASVDLSTFESSFESEFPVVLDSNLVNVDKINNATVKIRIDGLTTETFTVNNFSYTNLTEGYDASILSKNIEVVLRGTKEDLSNIKNEHIRAVIDLTDFDFTTGTFLLEPAIYVAGIDAANVGAIMSDKVQIEISRT